MQSIVRSNEPLSPVEARKWEGGTDVWLRKNIKGPLTEQVEGLTCTYYEADEAFFRTPEQIDADTVSADFEKFWARACAYDPQTQNEKVTDADVLEMRADIDYRLILVELGV